MFLETRASQSHKTSIFLVLGDPFFRHCLCHTVVCDPVLVVYSSIERVLSPSNEGVLIFWDIKGYAL